MPSLHGEIKSVDGKRVATPEYRSWQMMKNRCTNPNSRDWPYYGGRGVRMDPRWESYEVFLSDMGRKPSPKHTLDRVNSGGPYTKENCRWATRQEQARNREYASVRAWEVAQELGLSMRTVYHMMWEVREKDKGNTKHFRLSPENEARIRKYMKG